MENGRDIILNNEMRPVKCCFLLHWHIRGWSRAAQFITVSRRMSAKAQCGQVINDWRRFERITVYWPVPGNFIDLCIVFNFDLAWEDSKKMTAQFSCFSKCSVSSEWPISFPAVTPINILTASSSLALSVCFSPYSASWSSRLASQAKTWASCAPDFALAPQPPFP